MTLENAQNLLWSLLSDDEKKQHTEAYKQATANVENGIDKTKINYGKAEINSPAFLYFLQDGSYASQPNIVGEVFHASNGDAVVFFESKDIITLSKLYYGENILDI